MSQARIGKITLKQGGAEVRVLHRSEPNGGENWRGTMIQHARMIAEMPGEVTGFVMVGMFSDGTYSMSFRLDPDSPLGPTMLPTYVADILRRDIIGPKVVEENLVFD